MRHAFDHNTQGPPGQKRVRPRWQVTVKGQCSHNSACSAAAYPAASVLVLCCLRLSPSIIAPRVLPCELPVTQASAWHVANRARGPWVRNAKNMLTLCKTAMQSVKQEACPIRGPKWQCRIPWNFSPRAIFILLMGQQPFLLPLLPGLFDRQQ